MATIDLAETMERYRSTHGFDGVYVNARDRIVVPAGGTVDAIQMHAALGERVQAELRGLKSQTPIIHNSRTGYLAFVTGPAPGHDFRPAPPTGTNGTNVNDEPDSVSPRQQAGLFRNLVIRTVAGGTITLPGPGNEIHSWVAPPIGKVRADFETVARITIELGDALRRTT